MKQYSKRTAILHRVIFLLVIAAFSFGHQLEESRDGAQKLSLYPLHFLIGDLVYILHASSGHSLIELGLHVFVDLWTFPRETYIYRFSLPTAHKGRLPCYGLAPR